MLLRRFTLHQPKSLDVALALLEQHGEDATVHAGGTELLVALKSRVLHYDHLIDLKRIPELSEIRREGDKLVIGALATHHRIANHPLVRERYPAYALLSNNIANIRVRCAGTIGGNLCFAEPHADPPALLAALGAEIRLESPSGRREVAAGSFIEGAFETVRRPDEIATAVVLPAPKPNTGVAYRKFGHLERPAAGAAALLVTDEEGAVCRESRLWLGAIANHPVRLQSTEAACIGVQFGELTSLLARHAPAEIADVEAFDDIHGSAEYKRHLALVLLKRAIVAALPPVTNLQTAA